MIRIVPRLWPTRLASLVFLACPGRLRQIRLAIRAGLDGDPPIRIIDRRYNEAVAWFTVAPMTTGRFSYVSRVPTYFDGRDAVITVDQLRCVDRVRLVRSMGELDLPTRAHLLRALAAFFAP